MNSTFIALTPSSYMPLQEQNCSFNPRFSGKKHSYACTVEKHKNEKNSTCLVWKGPFNHWFIPGLALQTKSKQHLVPAGTRECFSSHLF